MPHLVDPGGAELETWGLGQLCQWAGTEGRPHNDQADMCQGN